MKNMALLIDTNVLLDWLLKRPPFVGAAEKIMEHCFNGNVDGYLASHSLTNVFYITRKDYSVEERKDIIRLLCVKLKVIGIDLQRILDAIDSDGFGDLEDALQVQCAYDEGMDYIVTRNINDFTASKVKALLPEEFLKLV